MPMINGAAVPVRPRSATRQDRMEPAPVDGTHSSSLDAHDAQSTVSGANRRSQRTQRRIINTPGTRSTVAGPVLPGLPERNGYMAAFAVDIDGVAPA